MSYPISMKESIKTLESTRGERLKEEIPRLSLEEREKLIRSYHPQHRDGAQRKLKVGVNKGELIPNEIADLFEAKSLIDPDKIDLNNPDYSVDVLVIGGGGGGASAALLAQETGAHVLLITKLRFGDSNTIMSEGGIQAAVDEQDSPLLHYLDTMGGGGFTNIPGLVRSLVRDAPEVLKWLLDLGVMFDRTPDERNILSSFAGGQCRRRVHSCADYSGLDMMRILRDETYNRGIEVKEFIPAIELILDDSGSCSGALTLDLETNKKSLIKAKTVILATGGSGRLHFQGFPTTNHYGATGDGLVIANRIGARIIFLDAIQFHPTGTLYPEHILGLLVTEAFRGWGAHLVNSDGKRFINELEKRDITAPAIIREVVWKKKAISSPIGREGVWLDTPLVEIINGQGTINRIFPHLKHRFQGFGIDITKEPILVYPTIHYQNGGILIDERGESGVKGLYVAGEASGGVHGRNRLGGNSLLDIFVFGRRAGKYAALSATEKKVGKLTLQCVKDYERELSEAGVLKDIASPGILPDYRYERTISGIYR
ncbi:hypothetical protein ES703_51286 [subsurface metagenome]